MSINGILASSNKKATATIKRASRPMRRFWPRAADAAVGLFALIIVAFVGLTYITPVAVQMSELAAGNKYVALADGLLNPFRSRSLLLNSGLPIYDLEIERGEFAAVEQSIAAAKKQGWMDEELQTWVNGKFFADGQEYDVKVRVRGDLPGHWEGAKKSWRIKFSRQPVTYNGTTIEEPIYFEGKHQINLIIPNDRDYVVAPFVSELMREAGLVTPHDGFAILRINGVLQGLYYEVEHFDKPLLAAHERPETTVFGQNGRAMHFAQYTKMGTPISADAKFDLGSIGLQVEEEGQLAMQALQAMDVLLEHAQNPSPANFRRAQAVLDWEKYLAFRNITTLFNTNHVRFGSDNLKLYFDTSRGLLEPIPWDVHLVRMPKEPGTIDFWNSHGLDELQRATLTDPQLRLQRNQMLWQWVSDGGDALIDQFDDWHDQIRPVAWADVLSTPIQAYKMDELRDDFVFNVRRVHSVISHSGANAVYRLESTDRAALEIASLNFSGILVRGIEINDPANVTGDYQLFADLNDNGELDDNDPLVAEATAANGTVRFALDQYVLPDVHYDGDTIDGRYWEYYDTLSGRVRFYLVGNLAPTQRHPLIWTPPVIDITAVNAVTEEPLTAAFLGQDQEPTAYDLGIVAYDASGAFDLDAPEQTLAEFLQAHPEFRISQQHPGAVELSGQVTLSETVIVPKAARLILQPGTDLTLRPGVSVLSYGGLTAIGTPDERIRIHGDESGEAWGVVAVVRTPHEVVLDYVDISGGGQAQINSILFTGGLAVHDADLRITRTTITDMQSEDGFNLKNGHIYMADCLIARNASDGVDLDFATGEVRNNRFLNQINDGLDISGSTLLVVHNRFQGNGDKGFSVGENSHPTVIDALFLRNNIGTSVKDLSHGQFAHVTFAENVIAIEAKRKKPFFGGGSGEFVNSVFAGNQTLLSDDYFSQDKVDIHHSLADDPVACPTCASSEILFPASDAGDYRMAADMPEADAELALPTWAETELTEIMPSAPGYFSEPNEQ